MKDIDQLDDNATPKQVWRALHDCIETNEGNARTRAVRQLVTTAGGVGMLLIAIVTLGVKGVQWADHVDGTLAIHGTQMATITTRINKIGCSVGQLQLVQMLNGKKTTITNEQLERLCPQAPS